MRDRIDALLLVGMTFAAMAFLYFTTPPYQFKRVESVEEALKHQQKMIQQFDETVKRLSGESI